MALIEVIILYSANVREYGREYANKHVLIGGDLDESLHKHIINTVNDAGEIVGVLGDKYKISLVETYAN